MRQIHIPLEYFDIEAFLNETIDYLKKQVSPEVDPTYGIVWVESPGDVPVYGPENGRDVAAAIKEERKMVFFPFAYADQDGLFVCSDGNSYKATDDEEDSEHGIRIGLEDSLGFLIKIEGDRVVINSAIHAGGVCPGPLASVDLCGDCGALEEPMTKFVERFVRA